MFNNNTSFDTPVQDVYQIVSNGNNVTKLYSSDEDYIFGINRLAICGKIFNVSILCFVLMESHFHTIVKGSFQNCLDFRNEYRRIMIKRLSMNGQLSNVRGRFEVDVYEIPFRTELMSKIIYVYRNPLEIDRKLLPEEYRWGVGRVYFVNHDRRETNSNRIGGLGARIFKSSFHTHVLLPKEWEYDDRCLIRPSSFVNWEYVESLFGSVKTFLASLKQKSDEEAAIRQQLNRRFIENLSFDEMKNKFSSSCKVILGKPYKMTDVKERIALATKLVNTKEVCVSSNLAKVVGVEYVILKKLLG